MPDAPTVTVDNQAISLDFSNNVVTGSVTYKVKSLASESLSANAQAAGLTQNIIAIDASSTMGHTNGLMISSATVTPGVPVATVNSELVSHDFSGLVVGGSATNTPIKGTTSILLAQELQPLATHPTLFRKQ